MMTDFIHTLLKTYYRDNKVYKTLDVKQRKSIQRIIKSVVEVADDPKVFGTFILYVNEALKSKTSFEADYARIVNKAIEIILKHR